MRRHTATNLTGSEGVFDDDSFAEIRCKNNALNLTHMNVYVERGAYTIDSENSTFLFLTSSIYPSFLFSFARRFLTVFLSFISVFRRHTQAGLSAETHYQCSRGYYSFNRSFVISLTCLPDKLDVHSGSTDVQSIRYEVCSL